MYMSYTASQRSNDMTIVFVPALEDICMDTASCDTHTHTRRLATVVFGVAARLMHWQAALQRHEA